MTEQEEKKTKYINPYTDFGFKRLFGVDANKDLLADFLNQLLPQKHQIKDLIFKNSENIPDFSEERKAIFDIHCESIAGEKFVVEMQKAKIKFFKDRAVFYITFPIREQAGKGEWNFKLNPIYYIALLDFFYDDKEEIAKKKPKFRRDVMLIDQDGEVFYDKLKFIFLQMPAFDIPSNKLESRYDKWCYFLQNLETFENIPEILKEQIFEKAFKSAEEKDEALPKISGLFSATEHSDYPNLPRLTEFW
jgi:predicted transposase/invertase (TIGR01784 family)